MPVELLTAKEAAHHLGLAVATLYAWLGLSDRGLLVIRGEPVTINYLRGGRRGQGRIRIEASELERIKAFMRVKPRPLVARRTPTQPMEIYPGITVPLGRPS